MKTIFITISRGGTARNILQTDVFKKLKESGSRLVILTPAWQDERFKQEFGAENVIFENLIEPEWTKADNFLIGWHKALIYNNSTRMRDLYGIYDAKEGGLLKYFFKKAVFYPLSKLRFLKEFLRRLDAVLAKDKYCGEIFDKYAPDLVFSTSIMEDADVYVLKQAKQRGIKTIGMAKTWDNISKMLFRVKTDKLIVWGEYSKEEAVKFQNFRAEDIIICGIPQFDFYKNSEYLMSRDEFCGMMGISPEKKIIVFASEGKIAKYEGETAEILADFINSGEIREKAALVIRPHFIYADDENKFRDAAKKENVVLDSGYRRSPIFRDRWDYSKEQIKKFTNMMAYADVVIASASTISLDAAAFGRPIINLAFDGRHKLPFAESIAHWYESEYSKNVVASGGVWLVDSANELKQSINAYFANPNLLSAGRQRLRDYFCHRIDGRSGERIAEAVLGHLNS